MTTTTRRVIVRSTLAGGLAFAVIATTAVSSGAGTTDKSTNVAGQDAFALNVEKLWTGLDHPWDIAFTPDRTMLVTERDLEAIIARLPDGTTRVLATNPPGVWHAGETGLMGLAVDPHFAKNRTIYICHGYEDDTGHDVRVTRWNVAEDYSSATQTGIVVKGFPSTSGRHGGCRIRFAPDGALYVGTGDSATGTVPQDRTSLGGKTLRIIAHTGKAWPGNPYEHSPNANKRLIYTYGHRNVQGLAWRRGDEDTRGMWSVEHGTDRDDEVNRLVPGGNYGWNPVPGYDESKPMTDFTLPGRQHGANWSSGYPTIAPSSATWLYDSAWGPWRGRLFVSVLGAETSRVFAFAANGHLESVVEPPELDGVYGRLRGATLGPDGALYVSTDNGGGNDVILRVTPRA